MSTLDKLIEPFRASDKDFFGFDIEPEKVNKLSQKEKQDLMIQCIKIGDLLKKE